jgi:3-oxoisoapionate kinase
LQDRRKAELKDANTQMSDSVPDSTLKLAFYGDDFTGSTDALEVLSFAGLRCALFLQVPSRQALTQLGPFDAIGVAGDSRAMTPIEMDQQLLPTLAAMADLPTALVHYKVCSTFDSSPTVGSIGHVIQLAQPAFAQSPFVPSPFTPSTLGQQPVPIVAATPALGRYCLFGHLFARSGTDGRVYRIDRHPIMSVHPVTPMGEADLVRHLTAQAPLSISKFELPSFAAGRDAIDHEFDQLLAERPQAIMFDGAEPAHLTETGRVLHQWAADTQIKYGRPLFAVGSSGLEYALTQWWRESKLLPDTSPESSLKNAGFEPVSQVLAISGSASALSALQIDAALAAGFVDLPIDAVALLKNPAGAMSALVTQASAALAEGQSVMLHTARGPKDERIKALIDALVQSGQSRDQAKHLGGRKLGQQLGQLVDTLVRQHPLQRLLLSGGDTSSQITRCLAPDALQIAAALSPGAPLCVALSDQPHLKGLQIALKGGQMGQADYFVRARDGLSPRQ